MSHISSICTSAFLHIRNDRLNFWLVACTEAELQVLRIGLSANDVAVPSLEKLGTFQISFVAYYIVFSVLLRKSC
jgi:hypothetical protein